MSLAQTVFKAVAQAKVQLGDLIVPQTLRRVATSYDKNTSKTISTEVVSTIDIAIIKFEFKEIDGTLVRTDDLKGIVFDTAQSIHIGDKVSFQSVEYEIHKITPTYAGNLLVLLEVQLRK